MDAPFVAGFWCGEGFVSIERCKTSYSLRVGFTNCDLLLLEEIQKFIGSGSILKKSRKDTWRQGYDLRWSSLGAIYVLELMQPYVIGEKKRKLELGLEFGHKFISSRGFVNTRNLGDDKDSMYELMKLYNTKGEHYYKGEA